LYTIPKPIIIEDDARCNDAAVTKAGKNRIFLLQTSNHYHIVVKYIQSMTYLKPNWSFGHGKQKKDE
jgi:hypothetical protein